MSDLLLGPDDGERLAVGPGSQVTIKAGGAMTGGTLYLGEVVAAPGFPGPPPHVHDRLHDMFYVLEGSLTVVLDGTDHVVGPGSFACVPPGVVHTFRNDSPAPVRLLNFNTPSGFEDYMRDLGRAAADGPIDQDRMGEIASRYDVRVV
jgi:quercetin dioxygenase-like cupin family protein